jgi:short-subunit dehydrogenase
MNYALITGASSGIGRCYAHELARRGYNIIAVSNQEHELAAVAEELRTTYNITAHHIYTDLATADAAKSIFDRCEAEGWQVEILVCNAGMLLFSTLLRTEPKRLETIVALHCTTTTLLCRYFGEVMKQRGKGRILLMSSSTAWLPYPTIAHYGATKAYIKNLAFALWYELHRHGVSVTAVFPGAVDTPFYNLRPTWRKWFVRLGIMHRAETIARRGIRAMMCGRRRLTPGLFTKFVVVVCAILPARVLDALLHIPPITKLLNRV